MQIVKAVTVVDSRAKTQMKPTRTMVETAIARLKSFSNLAENVTTAREMEKRTERISMEMLPRLE